MSDERGVVAPTIPVIVTAPVPFKVKADAPLIVLEKLMLEPVAMTGALKETGPVKLRALGVVEVALPPKLMAVGAV